jgi:hypothetical protein
MQTSEQIDALSAAMALAQGEMKPAIKDATNPHFKSKYADLSSVFEAVRGPFAKHGLSVWQELGNEAGGVTVSTRVVHKSGQWVQFGPLFVPASKQDAQGLGSAATYARRYGLAAALGVVADLDDDGNAASGKAPANTSRDDGLPQVKNAPGVSKARQWVSEFLRDGMGCEGAPAYMELCEGTKTHFVKICGVYPGVWVGPDGSGLRGEAQKIATIFQCRDLFDAFIKEVETAAVEIQ